MARRTLRDNTATRKRLERLSWLMDASIRLPGGYRIGWDAIIGLIPGLGDVAGGAISAYILFGAMQAGASKSTLLRMGGNIGIEMLFGAIPILGNIFDMAFKANLRNMRLLESQLDAPSQTSEASRRRLLGVVIGILLVLLLLAIVILKLVFALLGAIF